MKKTFLATLATLALALPSFAGKGDSVATKIQRVSTNVIYGVLAPGACLDSVVAKCDNATALLRVQTLNSSIVVTQALAAGQSNIFAAMTQPYALAAGDVLVIQSGVNFQRALVHLTNSTGIVLTNELTSALTDFALVPGDQVFKVMTTVFQDNVGGTRVTLGAPPIFQCNMGRPLLVDVVLASGSVTNLGLLVGGRQQ